MKLFAILKVPVVVFCVISHLYFSVREEMILWKAKIFLTPQMLFMFCEMCRNISLLKKGIFKYDVSKR